MSKLLYADKMMKKAHKKRFFGKLFFNKEATLLAVADAYLSVLLSTVNTCKIDDAVVEKYFIACQEVHAINSSFALTLNLLVFQTYIGLHKLTYSRLLDYCPDYDFDKISEYFERSQKLICEDL